jgi:predicted ATPase
VPLAVPPENADDADDPLQYGAVRLFVERTQAAGSRFAPDRRSATIAAICRRLDGIPLAIELAAACAATLGIEELAARLDDRFRVLTGGRRTALLRHQTARATLDWSYELLPRSEQHLPASPPVGFPGRIHLRRGDCHHRRAFGGRADCGRSLANLVANSLVVLDRSIPDGRWRLNAEELWVANSPAGPAAGIKSTAKKRQTRFEVAAFD